jgi:tRNA-dihydrouridine synthase B
VPGIEERIIVIRKHLMHSLRWKGPKLGILEMRPHYANYLKGLSHIKEFRMQLVHADSLDQIESIFASMADYYTTLEIN